MLRLKLNHVSKRGHRWFDHRKVCPIRQQNHFQLIKSCDNHAHFTIFWGTWSLNGLLSHLWFFLSRVFVVWGYCGWVAWQTRCTQAESGYIIFYPWWRHQMEAFSGSLALCVGNSLVTGEFPSQRPVTWSFDVFFDLCLNKCLSKQSWGCWFETPPRSLWHHCNAEQLQACSLRMKMILMIWMMSWIIRNRH